MSLLDERMLPDVRRRVPQMYDTLQAEDKYIEVILDFVGYLHDRMTLLRAEVMTPENLKARIKQLTGLDCDIIEDAEHLTITIRYHDDAKAPEAPKEEQVLAYVPAHLKVIIAFLKQYEVTKRLYAGAAFAASTRYLIRPMEINKPVKRHVEAKVSIGLFVQTKLIIKPQEDIANG